MATFNFDSFVDNPSEEIANISNAKKDEIISIAKHFKISFHTRMTKKEIKKLVIEGLISQELISEESRSLIDIEAVSSDPSVQLELARINLEREKFTAELARETKIARSRS